MGMGGMGMGGMGMMGMGGGYGASMFNGGGYGAGGYGGGYGYGGGNGIQQPGSPMVAGANAPAGTAQTPGGDLTGTYLGNAPMGGRQNPNAPRIIPNPYNNSLMIQATPQDYDQILNLLRDMDIPPRQVLIDARIYEVDLGSSLSSGVAATLQSLSTGTGSADAHHLLASLAGSAVNLSDGFLVGKTKELLAAVQVLEGETKAKVISAPSVIATDSIPASINVGVEVPTLTAQAVTGAQQNGTSLFANTIASRSTGVTLNITAQVNPSGIVTLIINQNVSAPQAASSGQIQSPSFSNRTVQTQVTVQDGDTIAVGGIITESNSFSTSGIPYLNRLPILGAAFGTRSYSKNRTELIVFMTPRVIYDTNQIQEASDELKGRLRRLERMVRDQ
jgi:general secretion pathway protein D